MEQFEGAKIELTDDEKARVVRLADAGKSLQGLYDAVDNMLKQAQEAYDKTEDRVLLAIARRVDVDLKAWAFHIHGETGEITLRTREPAKPLPDNLEDKIREIFGADADVKVINLSNLV